RPPGRSPGAAGWSGRVGSLTEIKADPRCLTVMDRSSSSNRPLGAARFLIGLFLIGAIVTAAVMSYSRGSAAPRPGKPARLAFRAKEPLDAGGFTAVLPTLIPWAPSASLEEIGRSFRGAGYRLIDRLDQELARQERPDRQRIVPRLMKAALFN